MAPPRRDRVARPSPGTGRPTTSTRRTRPRRCSPVTGPRLVIHCAAWTDVDGCARDPETAMRRNARAVRELAEATAAAGGRLLVVSTNEVFDGTRTDGRGYREDDPVEPPNAYGASKLAGERAAVVAFGRAGRPADLWVVRTAWLFGRRRARLPGQDPRRGGPAGPGRAVAGGRRRGRIADLRPGPRGRPARAGRAGAGRPVPPRERRAGVACRVGRAGPAARRAVHTDPPHPTGGLPTTVHAAADGPCSTAAARRRTAWCCDHGQTRLQTGWHPSDLARAAAASFARAPARVADVHCQRTRNRRSASPGRSRPAWGPDVHG